MERSPTLDVSVLHGQWLQASEVSKSFILHVHYQLTYYNFSCILELKAGSAPPRGYFPQMVMNARATWQLPPHRHRPHDLYLEE